MKKLLVATTVAMALSATAHADSTAQIKVQGVLTNDACTPTLSGGGTVDFGTIPVDTLSSTATNQLGTKDTTLSIACTSPTKVSWSIEDNVGDALGLEITNSGFSGEDFYADSNNSSRFGVGKTAGGVSIGVYDVAVNRSGSTADGVVKTVVYTGINNNSWAPFSTATRDHIDTYYQYSLTATNGTPYAPMAFTNAVFPLRIALAVDKTSTLAITDDTPIAGQATITLHYL